jgi:hypothetical protein
LEGDDLGDYGPDEGLEYGDEGAEESGDPLAAFNLDP